MEMILFCHPGFVSSQSMPRFAKMLKNAFEARGHTVRVLSPKAAVFNWVPRGRLSKWAGYFDQYILFPRYARSVLKRTSRDALLVFCDQALGPWVPLAKGRPHVVHVHDLLALRSALGDVPENPTSITGRVYQRYIRRGFRQARHFISISKNTRDELHRFGGVRAVTSEVVYNGLNFPYAALDPSVARLRMADAGLPVPADSMLLHVGGGQWYKNLRGVLAIYAQYAAQESAPLPLWCVGPEPCRDIKAQIARISGRGKVIFTRNVESSVLQAMYSLASAFLFPSLAEGFGWPLIEAQACRCLVLTTDEPPMNEVAGAAAYYVPRLQLSANIESWAAAAAATLRELLSESEPLKEYRKTRAQSWAQSFDPNKAVEGYLAVYDKIRHVPGSERSFESQLNPGANA